MTSPTTSRRIAYFAFDRDDAATRRRVAALQADGVAVDGFAMRRRDTVAPDWLAADLGLTRDNAYGQRLAAIAAGVGRARAQRDLLEAADVFLARNLDMLAIAALTRIRTGLRTPLIYECLDIHRLMCREDMVGRAMRGAEGWLLSQCAALWTSSPAFLREYFEPRQSRRLQGVETFLVENRMTAHPSPRPTRVEPPASDRPLSIGWFGNLRCSRSLSLMEKLSSQFGSALEIQLRGYPALGEIPDFDSRVSASSSIRFGGRYQAPEDLAEIYRAVDVVWAGDFMDAGMNSAWLLPNRLYEGGWFACPPIAPGSTETGRWIAANGVGFPVGDPVEETVSALIAKLIKDPRAIVAAKAAFQSLPDSTFIQPPGTMKDLIERVLETE